MITAIAIDDTPLEKRKPRKKATVAKPTRNVASSGIKVGDKPTSAKKARKSRKKADVPKPTSTREASKTSTILELLKRPGGATSEELMKATGWLAHSLRGFVSGTLRKKMGLTVTSTKTEAGRTYSIDA